MSEPAPWWRRRIVLVAAAAVAVLAAGGVVAVRAAGGGPAGLPAPRALAHDPVPAGRVFWTMPAKCGVGDETIAALTPRPSIQRDGDELTCEWSSDDTSKRGRRTLTVTLDPVHSGAGEPNAVRTTPTMAAAIERFTGAVAAAKSAVTPLRGLGDEAALTGGPATSEDRAGGLVFRAGNTVVNVGYRAGRETGDLHTDKSATPELTRDAVTRAATDVARSLGVPASPSTAPSPARAERAALPRHICASVPEDLRDRLLGGGDDADLGGKEGDTDPLSAIDRTGTGTHSASCAWGSGSRVLNATVTIPGAADPATALRDASRDYLRRHYTFRDEQPISAHDARAFHALAGAGDQGFCAYLEESARPVQDGDGPARCVIRTGTAIVTVAYASRGAPGDDGYQEPLTAREAVNGAYAAVLPVLRAVRS